VEHIHSISLPLHSLFHKNLERLRGRDFRGLTDRKRTRMQKSAAFPGGQYLKKVGFLKTGLLLALKMRQQ
jgi:hypothetical protein